MMLLNKVVDISTNAKYSVYFAGLLWLIDVVFCLIIIKKIPYTEIDWIAYMQQVRQIVNGQLNYIDIKGDTGPLVYPAGHVWIFQILYYLTDNGENLLNAQYIFMGLYLFTLLLVLRIYVKARIPPYILPLLILSKRLHSIYLLRLFNDCFGTLFAVIAVSFLQSKRWLLSAIVFSIGISVKMNGLLFLPGVGIIYLRFIGFKRSILLGIPMALVQIIVGWKFLAYNPISYISKAFEFSRVFLYKWTVNWRFIKEETFLSKEFSTSLLLLHVILLTIFCIKWYNLPLKQLSNPRTIVKIATLSNLIGILCARSLHYQFYSWFQWTIPFLLYTSSIPFPISFIIYFAQEYSWNVYPSTPLSSSILILSLALIINTNFFFKTTKM